MVVICARKCWDSKRSCQYYPGDQDDIDPLEPIAMYFTFPPGTVVYDKPKANRRKAVTAGTRVVPGMVTEKERLAAIATEEAELQRQADDLKRKREVLEATIGAEEVK